MISRSKDQEERSLIALEDACSGGCINHNDKSFLPKKKMKRRATVIALTNGIMNHKVLIPSIITLSLLLYFYLMGHIFTKPFLAHGSQGIIINKSEKETRRKQQKVCILAGPHKTGSSSIQTNMYQWSEHTISFTNMTNPPGPKPAMKWIWPVPIEIAETIHDYCSWWHPAKAFYPMIEAMLSRTSRKLFQIYTPQQVIEMYHETIVSYWEKGYDIVFGTEAMDNIARSPQTAKHIINQLSTHVLPSDIKDDQITVVVTYRLPKIKHLISMWHQKCEMEENCHFYDFVMALKPTMVPMNALKMTNLLLHETKWNVELVDLSGTCKNQWDYSVYVACVIMGEKCENKTLSAFLASQRLEPTVANVKADFGLPNVPESTLESLDELLVMNDCAIAMQLLRKSHNIKRFRIHFPEDLENLSKYCKDKWHGVYPYLPEDIKHKMEDILQKGGRIET